MVMNVLVRKIIRDIQDKIKKERKRGYSISGGVAEASVLPKSRPLEFD